jgi:hypothetical protein
MNRSPGESHYLRGSGEVDDFREKSLGASKGIKDEDNAVGKVCKSFIPSLLS